MQLIKNRSNEYSCSITVVITAAIMEVLFKAIAVKSRVVEVLMLVGAVMKQY